MPKTVNPIGTGFATPKIPNKISVLLGTGIIVLICTISQLVYFLPTVDNLCRQGKYKQAYDIATTDEQKMSVIMEAVIAEQMIELNRRNQRDNPTTELQLIEAYYNEYTDDRIFKYGEYRGHSENKPCVELGLVTNLEGDDKYQLCVWHQAKPLGWHFCDHKTSKDKITGKSYSLATVTEVFSKKYWNLPSNKLTYKQAYVIDANSESFSTSVPLSQKSIRHINNLIKKINRGKSVEIETVYPASEPLQEDLIKKYKNK